MELLSVGIDIGTSTTQLVFSLLRAENTASYFAVPRIAITDTQVVYRSGIHRTPLLPPANIDGEAVRQLVAQEYAAAGYTPAQVQTGAVIITGESARKQNAEAVLNSLSGFAGELVVSTAGPDMEAIIAGQGSGAQAYSRSHGCTVVNLDIGGGTTNLAAFCGGEVVAKGCLDIGGRLVHLDDAGRVSYISPAAAQVAGAVGAVLRLGEPATAGALQAVATGMAGVLEQQLGLVPTTELLQAVRTPGSSSYPVNLAVQAVFFSGGVADCMAADGDPLRYGDLGIYLGRAIAQGRIPQQRRVIASGETIRATVVGAGCYTTSLSGSTICYHDGVFPRKNLPVLRLTAAEEQSCFAGDAEPLRSRLRWFLDQCDASVAAVAMQGSGDPDYPQLTRLAGCLCEAMDSELPTGEPLILVLQCDMAKALGQLMRGRLAQGRRLAVVDGIDARQGEYLDFGKPIMNGAVIPVVVKTLIFG